MPGAAAFFAALPKHPSASHPHSRIMAAQKEDVNYRPFTSAAQNSSIEFWRAYCDARPSPTEDFFQQIVAYHKAHGETSCDVAHDVGTGPANVAWRLAPYFRRVVGSDINDSALEAGLHLVPERYRSVVTLIKASAEDLASAALPSGAGVGETDLVVISMAMPLIDAEKTMAASHALLRPGGSLAIYVYGRPIFPSEELNTLYEGLASRICSFFLPFAGAPGEPAHRRSADTLASYLDNIAVPPASWAHVERHKWNVDRPLIFNGRQGYDFDWNPVDRRAPGETNVELVNRNLWQQHWDISQVKAYLASNYPRHQERAGARYSELEPMYAELEQAMGGPSVKSAISFPVVLILATKK